MSDRASLLGKRLLLAAGASCVAALLGWAALRVADRISNPRGPRPPFRPGREDPMFGWVLLPDWHARHVSDDFDVEVRTNAFGQRGAARDPAKPPGVRRILLVGDSFAFGWGVPEDQIFAARMQQQLTAQLPPPAGTPPTSGAPGAPGAPGAASAASGAVEVIDAGVPGWNTASEYLFLARAGFDWQPDLVLLQLCSNDFTDFTYFRLELDARNLPVAVQTRSRLGDAERQRLLEEAARSKGETGQQLAEELSQSELNDLVAQGYRRLVAERRAAAGAPPEGAIETLSADEVRRGLDTGAVFQARYLRYLVAAIGELCAAHGVPLRLLAVDANTLADDEGEAALAALCAESSGHCLPSSAFIAGVDVRACFFRRDPHWTPEGHRRAAAALCDWLRADAELHFGAR